jgi:23S rRNA pseudouridine1911/1915/1917 synthase
MQPIEPATVPQLSTKPVDLTVKRKVEGCRLDQYLVSAFPGYSRSVVQKVIDAKAVTVNGVEAKASYRVRCGDHIRLWLPDATANVPVAEDIPLDVIYEDEFLAVINKPADMVVHPAKGHWRGTLVNALQHHFGQLSRLNGDYRPGIVHRLDRDTSGVILVAKDEMTHRDLGYQFEHRKIFKEYVALTQGVLDRDSDYIECAIGRHPHDRVKMAAYDEADEEEDIKEACTFYEVIERFDGYTFCRAYPKTGRTHQIRVHLAHVGCPVLADKAYSGRDTLRLSHLVPSLNPAQDEVLMPRQALHARRLRFHHPRLQQLIEAEAKLPPEFERTLEALRKYKPMR